MLAWYCNWSIPDGKFRFIFNRKMNSVLRTYVICSQCLNRMQNSLQFLLYWGFYQHFGIIVVDSPKPEAFREWITFNEVCMNRSWVSPARLVSTGPIKTYADTCKRSQCTKLCSLCLFNTMY